ncbi:metallophosphoesterase family protein [Comamonas humi]
MQLQILSDLHLETDPRFRAVPAPGADVLVLAGDIGSYQPGSRLAELGDGDFGLAQFSPRSAGGSWPVPVLMVPGNHEFDGMDFDLAYQRLAECCERLGIVLLERRVQVLGGVRFVGTALWSDFDAIALQAGVQDVASLLKQREKAYKAANFYLSKTAATRHGEPFLAAQIRDEALRCQQWLREALQQPFDGPTVAITHFAPSLRSADPRYGLTPGTAGFCNQLDALLPLADLWIHGHLHAPSDYVVSGTRDDGRPWRCRVVANPLGYARKGEQEGFRPGFTVQVPAPGR